MMQVTSENILVIIRSTLDKSARSMNQVITAKILELGSMTQKQAEVFCSILKGSFKDSLGDFVKVYSHFVECGNFIMIKGSRIVGHNESVAKVYRRIAKLLLATASDEEILSYAKNVKRFKKDLTSERDKLQPKFRKKQKGDKK
ncbi:MAG: hypothetical protein PHG92_04900 [Patescibacteria group bacterium]|nr:hypothetical protein [Patescibacteria group bacterium]